MEKNVLVIDDEERILSMMERILSPAGYHVTGTTDGALALELIKANGYPVMFIDLFMPEMDGVTLCREIRKFDTSSYIYCFSGNTHRVHYRQCSDAGFDDFFVKPGKVEELVGAVRNGFAAIERWGNIRRFGG